MYTVHLATLAILAMLAHSTTAFGGQLHEDFTTTTYLDPGNTTALWDTAAGELRLHPWAPTLIGNYDTPHVALDVELDGDYAFVADGLTGIVVLNISNPANPWRRGGYPTPVWATRIVVHGNQLFVTLSDFSLLILDVSDPANPTLAGSYDQFHCSGVAVRGDYAYVAGSGDGLLVLDVSDPANPAPVFECCADNLPTRTNATSVVLEGDFAYFTSTLNGLIVFDISDPVRPSRIADRPMPPGTSSVSKCAIEGGHAFVPTGTAGTGRLVVVDILDPANPTLAGTLDTAERASDVAVLGDRAYLNHYTGGLALLDISDPTSPTLVHNYNTPGSSSGVVARDDCAFVTDGAYGLQVIDVAEQEWDSNNDRGQSFTLNDGLDLVASAMLVTAQTAGVTWELTANGGTHWQAFPTDGLWYAFDHPGTDLRWRSTHSAGGTNPTAFGLTVTWSGSVPTSTPDAPANRKYALHGASPNPFNPSTTVSFELGMREHVRLAVYDVAGRLVRTIIDEVRSPGVHRTPWDGRDFDGLSVGSGVYFCRIEAGSFSATKRMVLVK